MKKHADEIHEKLQSLETIVKGSQDGKIDKQGNYIFFYLKKKIIFRKLYHELL